MNEQDVRALVREAIERHLGRPEKRFPDPFSDEIREKGSGNRFSDSSPSHASHILLKVLPGSEVDEGMCVIEPAVRCNHCGFCQSYGH
jgi:hypothetical protein